MIKRKNRRKWLSIGSRQTRSPAALQILDNTPPLKLHTGSSYQVGQNPTTVNGIFAPWAVVESNRLQGGAPDNGYTQHHVEESFMNNEDSRDLHSTTNTQPTHRQPKKARGDFNVVEDSLDRQPPRADPPAPVTALKEFKALSLLRDGWQQTYPTKTFFTWTHGSTESRLDHIYMQQALIKYSTDWDISPAPFQTDHDVVLCRVLNPEEPYIGKGRWAIPHMVIENKEFIQKVVDEGMKLQGILQTSADYRPSLQAAFATFKKGIIRIAKQYASKTASMLD
ncbi:hypothetical protein M422DRAFT_265937 [Sphaerobolus stellatus SS14]|uniref:Uncharacterized protein n=1 Tax=Sphaerobolus stellatus (strain SS14) TaxID=990650 RepID=A0A0C9USR2_SPHS4|nr:hypothetical protein M422DRAFT_265937 [Sphaerobolus stellatus SS14]